MAASSSSSAEQAMLAHIVGQMQAHAAFLAQHDYITPAVHASIVASLPAVSSAPAQIVSTPPLSHTAPVAARSPPPPAPRRTQKAKALWAYNENGTETNDLSFAAGDIIDIVEETNNDWWTGEYNGRRGLFPSNHVEKIATSPTMTGPIRMVPPMPTYSAPPYAPPPTQVVEVKKAGGGYKPFRAAYAGSDTPPPPPVVAPPTNSMGLQEAPGRAEKQARNNALKNTMMHSAAAGLGGGAGMALGGGLVRKII